MSEMVTPDGADAVFVQWLENLRVDLAESVGGIVLRGARPVAIGVTSGATRRPTQSPGALVGYAIRNRDTVSAVTVSVLFHDGHDENADVILTVTLAPGESVRDWFGPGGINLSTGLFITYVDDLGNPGDIDGSVFLRGAE